MEREKRRTSAGTSRKSIAESHNVGLLPDREPLTSDLAAFGDYIDRMKKTKRLEQDPPFNESFWAHVRSILEKATPNGFHNNSEQEQQQQEEETGDNDDPSSSTTPTSFQIKTQTDINAVVEKIRIFDHIMPCSPNLLAKDTGIPLADVLIEFFYATRIGLTDMLWIPECFRCGGSVCHKGMLENIPREAYCSGCVALSKQDYLDQIKTVFVFTSSVFYVPMTRIQNFPLLFFQVPIMHFLAMAAPITSLNRVGYRYVIGDSGGEENDLKPLARGKYRVLCACTGIVFILEVQGDASAADEPCHLDLRASSITKAEGVGQPLMTFTIPHGKVSLDIIADTASLYMPFIVDYLPDEDQHNVPPEFRVPYLSATACIHHRSFGKLFPNQIVSRNTFFKIQRVVLVFTDVVGSTALYESFGDGPALDLVQTHFKVLFSSLSSRGRVVKTIGDAVMAAFTNGRDAILAVAEALRTLPQECKLPKKNDGTSSSTTLNIRVGVHSGPTVVVPLNGINDYFGSTVNQSARVEGKADSAECLVTEAVLSEPAAVAAFEQVTRSDFVETRDVTLPLKGVAKPIRCRGFRLRGT